MNHTQLRELLVTKAKQAYDEGLFAGTSGNLSLFDPDRGEMIITPTSTPYATMQECDAVSMKLDGTVTIGERAPSSEWRMHAAIYRTRRDIKAVVHTHSPYATSFAVTHTPIPVVLIEMVAFLGGDIKVAEFGMPGTYELGEAVLVPLESRGACLMANHGVVAVGDTLERAHIRAVYAEDAAKIYALAASHGTPKVMSDEQVEGMKKGM